MKLFEIVEDQKQLLDKIRADCAPFLEAVKGTTLWRGFYPGSMSRELAEGVTLNAVRNDRKPRDSELWRHEALNDMFISKVGIPVRSASIFCSFCSLTTDQFGPLHAIFPVGEFHYAWSPYIEDVTMFKVESPSASMDKWVKRTIRDLDMKIDGELYEPQDLEGDERRKVFTHMMSRYGDKIYKLDAGLAQAKSSRNEVMIVCDKYYAIHWDKGDMISAVMKKASQKN